jgi:UDP-N-acetylglucosamine 2-epimerase (non-hydrolysing)
MGMLMRKIAIFTGTRAEYGLLYWLMKDIQSAPDLDLQLIVSGMHLSSEFGSTYKQIEKDGFIIDEKIEMLLSSDSSVGVAKSMGLGVIGFSDALSRMSPDVIVLLGDRFEALAMAQTALIMRIPILHIHGGEITEGAYDDAIRHSITKLSVAHCTSTAEYRERVIQLGEHPSTVTNVGAIGLDYVKRAPLFSLEELSSSLSFQLCKPFSILTYHPVTLANEDAEKTFASILDALEKHPSHQLIITYPNADDGGRKIIKMIESYASSADAERVVVIPSLGQKRYLSAVKYADFVIGNSSSGVIEVPSFGIPTINIGARQKGRMAAESVLHSGTSTQEIASAINTAISLEHKKRSSSVNNPYGEGKACQQIIKILGSMSLSCVKTFYDLNGAS